MFDLTTEWMVDAPLERAWNLVREVEAWPGWWANVRSVRLVSPGDESGVGAAHEFVWRTALPYEITLRMEVVRIDPLQRIEGRATGDLEGCGIWTFERSGRATLVRYRWTVGAEKAWMKVLAPLLHRLFAWNHKKVMETGRTGMERLLARDRPGFPA